MRKINNFEELSNLIFLNMKKNMITNNFMSREELEFEIKNGKLYYIEFDKGLFIFRDRGDFYILNYYICTYEIEELKDIFSLDVNKMVVIEIPAKKVDNPKYINTIKIFELLGFEIVIKRERFAKKEIKECNTLNNVYSVEKSDVNIDFCEMPDALAVHKILSENFDLYYGCIPIKEKLQEDIVSKCIYKATIEGKIVGILHFSRTKNSSEIKHLCVNKEYRNTGIASKLLERYDAEINLNKTVWTGSENISAQKVYINFGYIKDGYVSTVLKKLPRGA